MSEQITSGRLEIELATSPDEHHLTLSGQVDEQTQLVDLAGRLDHKVVLDLERVSFVNSVGIREWIRMLRVLDEHDLEVRMVRCSEAMIHQMNMIVEAKGRAGVDSFFAPYLCAECGYEGSMCLEVADHAETLARLEAPEVSCPECNGRMEFNEIPGRYLLFLEE